MAHIVAATTGGPRDIPIDDLTAEGRAQADNIVLLCANCHTVVDKDSGRYPRAEMLRWKATSQKKATLAFGTPQCSSRLEAHAYVEPLLSQNRIIFERYGPRRDNFSEERSAQWRKHVVQAIIPNNAAINRLLTHNRKLLNIEERIVSDEFAIHAQEFAARHILGEWAAGTQRFPIGMVTILKGDV